MCLGSSLSFSVPFPFPGESADTCGLLVLVCGIPTGCPRGLLLVRGVEVELHGLPNLHFVAHVTVHARHLDRVIGRLVG